MLTSEDMRDMDINLAKIILPAIKELRYTKQGIPKTDTSDGPFESTEELKELEEEQYMLGHSKQRWNYLLGEMVWSSEQATNGYEILYQDLQNYDENRARLSNGFRLFGKYYMSLYS